MKYIYLVIFIILLIVIYTSPKKAEVVYVDKNSGIYHLKKECKNVPSNSYIYYLTEHEAETKGYTICNICNK